MIFLLFTSPFFHSFFFILYLSIYRVLYWCQPYVVVAFIVLLFCFCLKYIDSELNFHGQNASLHICRSLYLLGMKMVSPARAIEICIYFRCTWETDSILLQHFCYLPSLHSKGKELRDIPKPIKCDRKLTKTEIEKRTENLYGNEGNFPFLLPKHWSISHNYVSYFFLFYVYATISTVFICHAILRLSYSERERERKQERKTSENSSLSSILQI